MEMMSSDGTLLISAHHWNNIPNNKALKCYKSKTFVKFYFLSQISLDECILPQDCIMYYLERAIFQTFW